MSTMKSIRVRLGVTQAELATVLGKTQGNISFYERGQEVPPETARKLIEFARSRGHEITFNDIYAQPAMATEPAATVV